MKRKKIKSGDVIQIPLPKNIGFAYAQYIDLIELNPDNRYPCLLAFFNVLQTNSLASVDSLIYENPLLCPHLVGGVQTLINRGEWEVMGNISKLSVSNIPDYKYSDPDSLIEDELSGRWFNIPNANILEKKPVEYLQVKHLERLGAVGASLISTKIAMAFIKERGEKIEDYFELHEFYEKVFFWQIMNSTPYYKQPNDIQGKMIEL